MSRIAILLAAVSVAAAQQADIARPAFLKTHRVWSEHDLMSFQVRIEPHRDIRAVIVEAWALESDEQEVAENGFFSEWQVPVNPRKVALVRSSADDAEGDKRIYRFEWKAGLDKGDYSLIAKVYLGMGRHVESVPLIILVR